MSAVYCGDSGCHWSDESEAKHLERHPWCAPGYVPAIGDVRRGSFGSMTWDGSNWTGRTITGSNGETIIYDAATDKWQQSSSLVRPMWHGSDIIVAPDVTSGTR